MFISPGLKAPNISCGGDELLLSADETVFDSCSETSYEGENDCKLGLKKGFWSASKPVEESVIIKFKYRVKPTKIVITQPEDLTNMSRQVEVRLDETNTETLDCIQNKEPQTFKIKNPVETKQIVLTVKNTFGGQNAGGNFKVYGIGCTDLDYQAFMAVEKEREDFGMTKVIPENNKGCIDTMDSLTGYESIIKCVENCDVNEDMVFAITPGNYALNSSPCIAAKMYYKGKPEATSKLFGIRRTLNDVTLPNGNKPPYAFNFDMSLVNPKVE